MKSFNAAANIKVDVNRLVAAESVSEGFSTKLAKLNVDLTANNQYT